MVRQDPAVGCVARSGRGISHFLVRASGALCDGLRLRLPSGEPCYRGDLDNWVVAQATLSFTSEHHYRVYCPRRISPQNQRWYLNIRLAAC